MLKITAKDKEIRRLRDLILQIGDVIDCNEYGSEQACVDVKKLIDSELCLPNLSDQGPASAGPSASRC